MSWTQVLYSIEIVFNLPERPFKATFVLVKLCLLQHTPALSKTAVARSASRELRQLAGDIIFRHGVATINATVRDAIEK